MENSQQSRGVLKFLKHHFLNANLETDFKEDNTVLTIFFLLRGLHSTLNLSHDYSPLAEGKRSAKERYQKSYQYIPY